MIVRRQAKMRGAGEVGGHHQILDHRHAFEGARNLEAARNPAPRAHVRRQPRDVLAAKDHGRGLGTEGTGNAVDQRGLAGAVGTDQAEALAGLDIDADIVERGEAAEALGQPLDPQQRKFSNGRGRHVLPSARRPRRNSPMMPSGAATTNSTSMTPSTSTFTSEDMVTARSCWVTPSTMAPITGPIQCEVPQINASPAPRPSSSG